MVASDDAVALVRAMEAAFPFEAQRKAPGFEDLARRVAGVWSAAGSPAEAARPLRDMGRFTAAMLITHLEATPGGLSLARLRALVERPGLGGIGHGRAVLTYLRYLGYLEPLSRTGDGRVQLYRVTDTIRTVLRARLRRELEARADVDPVVPQLLARLDEEGLFTTFVVAASEATQIMLRESTPRDNPCHVIGQRQNGLIVLCELAARGGAGDVFPPRGPLDYAIADVARRSGASRMQVSHLLRKAREDGHLIVGPDGRDRFSPELADGLERTIASSTLLLVGAARIALTASD